MTNDDDEKSVCRLTGNCDFVIAKETKHMKSMRRAQTSAKTDPNGF